MSSADDGDGSSSHDDEEPADDDEIDRDTPRSQTEYLADGMPLPAHAGGGMISYDSSPFLELKCSRSIAVDRGAALLQVWSHATHHLLVAYGPTDWL